MRQELQEKFFIKNLNVIVIIFFKYYLLIQLIYFSMRWGLSSDCLGYYVTQVGFKHTLIPRLCLPSAGVTDVCHYTQIRCS